MLSRFSRSSSSVIRNIRCFASQKKALVAIADGSEDIEAISVIDLLRRANIDVTTASVMKNKTITTAHGIKIESDKLIDEVKNQTFDCIVYPGGLPGADHLRDSQTLTNLIKKQKESKRLCAAICASPAVGFETHGILKGEKATCYPGFECQFKTAKYQPNKLVVTSNNVITSKGPGTTIPFALEIINYLEGTKQAQAIADQIVYEWKH